MKKTVVFFLTIFSMVLITVTIGCGGGTKIHRHNADTPDVNASTNHSYDHSSNPTANQKSEGVKPAPETQKDKNANPSKTENGCCSKPQTPPTTSNTTLGTTTLSPPAKENGKKPENPTAASTAENTNSGGMMVLAWSIIGGVVLIGVVILVMKLRKKSVRPPTSS